MDHVPAVANLAAFEDGFALWAWPKVATRRSQNLQCESLIWIEWVGATLNFPEVLGPSAMAVGSGSPPWEGLPSRSWLPSFDHRREGGRNERNHQAKK